MKSLQVTPASQTGHRDIDGQVRTLFAIANEVLFSKELEESPDRFRHALRLFVTYLDYHFASEQVAMAESQYPDRHIHADFHAFLLQEATAIEERVGREGSSVETRHALLHLVEDWLYYHVQEADGRFADFLRETSAKQETARLPGIYDLGASSSLARDFDEQMLKWLVELGHPERLPRISQTNESSPRAEREGATRA
jgi:hemerythrin-like metal-binding protein